MKVSIALHNCFPSLANYLKLFLDKEKRTDTNYFKAEIVSDFLCNCSKIVLQRFTIYYYFVQIGIVHYSN